MMQTQPCLFLDLLPITGSCCNGGTAAIELTNVNTVAVSPAQSLLFPPAVGIENWMAAKIKWEWMEMTPSEFQRVVELSF
jgi:hypothetical protein